MLNRLRLEGTPCHSRGTLPTQHQLSSTGSSVIQLSGSPGRRQQRLSRIYIIITRRNVIEEFFGRSLLQLRLLLFSLSRAKQLLLLVLQWHHLLLLVLMRMIMVL